MSCLLPPACAFCKHYLGEDDSENRECLAFKEIPDNIIKGFEDHIKPYEGDNGFQFILNETYRDDFENVKQMKQAFSHYTKNDHTVLLEQPVSKISAWDGI